MTLQRTCFPSYPPHPRHKLVFPANTHSSSVPPQHCQHTAPISVQFPLQYSQRRYSRTDDRRVPVKHHDVPYPSRCVDTKTPGGPKEEGPHHRFEDEVRGEIEGS